ncbi:hypothetical protein HD597_011268 [Nonomuraea thailandensis]|uniref:Uncharacterized protein n=1 Tax=Nonomuraea thailandensis TaxID=1188745 RepID=A0A9X2H0C3_9ACTN|nr:hypothetical protein [Nonomuraea thailandensis]MCP2364248.1 hypothetical protein [Nonomuraea thailandensis]
MTERGRYSSQRRPQPVRMTQIRIVGPAAVVEQVRQVLEAAAETMPGWHIDRISRQLAAERPEHVRRYVDLEVHDA